MPVKAETQVGQKYEMETHNGKKDYIVTGVGNFGYIRLQRTTLPKSKIDRVRFPEFISLKLK